MVVLHVTCLGGSGQAGLRGLRTNSRRTATGCALCCLPVAVHAACSQGGCKRDCPHNCTRECIRLRMYKLQREGAKNASSDVARLLDVGLTHSHLRGERVALVRRGAREEAGSAAAGTPSCDPSPHNRPRPRACTASSVPNCHYCPSTSACGTHVTSPTPAPAPRTTAPTAHTVSLRAADRPRALALPAVHRWQHRQLPLRHGAGGQQRCGKGEVQ